MHFPRFLKIFGLLPLLLVGCSTTVASRFGGTPQSKSIAVVGERPLPASTGEPGGKVVASEEEPEPRRNPKTRISGRVLDPSGEPVSGAIVRLADGATKGGREIRASTDQSGGFTLNGLRPGSSYVLIAESDDERGPIMGRVEARTAETGVEISLESPEKAISRRSNRTSRARPISQRDESAQESETRPSVNRDDIDSPDSEADSIDPGPPEPERVGRPQLSTPLPTAGWRNGNNSSANAVKDFYLDRESPTDRNQTGSRSRSVAETASDESDEESNPLPPALDREDTEVESVRMDRTRPRSSPSAKTGEPRTVRPSGELELAPISRLESGSLPLFENDLAMVSKPNPLEAASESSLLPDPDPVARGSSRRVELEPQSEVATSQPSSSAPTTTFVEKRPQVASREGPDPLPPPGPAAIPSNSNVSATLPASQPVFASQDGFVVEAPKVIAKDDYNPFAALTSKEKVVATRNPVSPAEMSPEPNDVLSKQETAPKKKWGEVAERVKPEVVVEPTKATFGSTLFRRKKANIAPVETSIASCSFDSKLRKINDFRLPDLEGKPVRFQDLDADFVLLDFWGTWCAPCLDSIPYLVELQKKYGPDKLKVVGIACEDLPLEARKAKVDEIARKYEINYPILMSTMDGKPCPVQQALQVQAMPTLILVDRRGQVLWRNTGATPAVENRLDRILALSMSRADTARR
jgi:thiol-disulfide isomerase/thioredoxin